MKHLLVYTTFGSREEAQTVAEGVVSMQLASCANIIDGMAAIYMWKGNIEKATETICLFKTTVERYKALQAYIKEHHSYELPCIIALPITDGLPEFLSWVTNSAQP